jgi:HSP20 family protein
VRLLAQARWRPDVDLYETAAAIEIVVDLAGVEEEDIDVQLYDDVLVVEGRRALPSCPSEARYHTAAIRQGPFQVALPLPSPVEPDLAEASYDRGLLRVTLRKRSAG